MKFRRLRKDSGTDAQPHRVFLWEEQKYCRTEIFNEASFDRLSITQSSTYDLEHLFKFTSHWRTSVGDGLLPQNDHGRHSDDGMWLDNIWEWPTFVATVVRTEDISLRESRPWSKMIKVMNESIGQMSALGWKKAIETKQSIKTPVTPIYCLQGARDKNVVQ